VGSSAVRQHHGFHVRGGSRQPLLLQLPPRGAGSRRHRACRVRAPWRGARDRAALGTEPRLPGL